jgi:hypothetical protein
MKVKKKIYPEPVPAASQLAALPFLAAIEGSLRGSEPKVDIRLTLHRVLNRQGEVYLQQVCPYLGSNKFDKDGEAGRMFPVDFGIIGAAFERSRVMRTKRYPSMKKLRLDIAKDLKRRGDTKDPATERLSWLAVPFIGPSNTPVLILFADTYKFNFFADDNRMSAVANMCWGFCRLIDSLEDNPFPNLRNFGFEPGKPVKEKRTVYRVQEEVSWLTVPRFKKLESFNYDSSGR